MTRAELIQLMRQCDLIDFRDEDDDQHVAQLVDAVEALVVKATKVEQDPFIWYDPETGVTWTNDALAEGYSAEGLIPLYAAPQPAVEDRAKPVAWMASDNGDIVHASQFEDAPGGRWDRPLYIHSQNLSCKSNQARLATLWGYVKEQPQQEQEWKRRLGNLLAVIHGDGGHYIEAHGWDKAQADAEERVARVMTGLPQSASVVWPRTASEVRAFLSGHVAAERYARDDHQPDDSDTYTLSAHDLLGAIDWWTDCAQRPRQPLTEMEIVELRQLTPGTLDVQFVLFARAIERAHGIGCEK